MDSKVIYECQYGSGSTSRGSVTSWVTALICFVCLWLITSLFSAKLVFLSGLVLLAAVIRSVLSLRRDREHHTFKMQVTETKLRVIRDDGEITRAFDLRDIPKIYTAPAGEIVVRVKTKPFSEQSEDEAIYTLCGAKDSGGIVAVAKRQIEKLQQEEGSGQKAVSAPLPAASKTAVPLLRPRALTEEETDELHAAQHLLNQGMISPKQYSGLLVPPVPERAPAQIADINDLNAADYQQRQEQLAQQLGTVPLNTADEKEKDENGRAGFI